VRAYNGYKKGTPTQDAERLPADGYVIRIMKAEEVTYQNGDTGLKLYFDIDEGKYKGFYGKNYASQGEPKKWKGTYSFSTPNDDAEEKYKHTFENRIACITESNPNYEWDFNENTLEDKVVGAVFCNQEYDFDGKKGFFTKCVGLRTASAIRENKYKIPADRFLDNSNNNAFPIGGSDENFTVSNEDSDDLPF